MSASFAMITLGCAKNEVDSNRMRALLVAANYVEKDDPTDADLVIVNTCAFITAATEEAIATILEAADLPRVKDYTSKLVVTGCLSSRYEHKAIANDSHKDTNTDNTSGDNNNDVLGMPLLAPTSELERELPEVSAFVSVANEDNIVAIANALLNIQNAKAPNELQTDLGVSKFIRNNESDTMAKSSDFNLGVSGAQVARIVDAPWAYIKIADGCSRRCSFCTIPAIRGPYRSFKADEILAEANFLVNGGVRELILIAQDTGLWHDKERGWNLAKLLDELATLYKDTWIRVMYLQPQGVTQELLLVMQRHSNICNYLDIPLQHASPEILLQMNRSGSGNEYLKLLAQIRDVLPDVSLRTTMIAGFPGETRLEAQASEKFIDQAGFNYVGVFEYSQEEGTKAAALTKQVPKKTAMARAQRLRDIADVHGFAQSEELVGKTLDVLVCGICEEGFYGRTQGMAPEVDGLLYIINDDKKSVDAAEPKFKIGDIIVVQVTQSVLYELYGIVQ